MTGFPHLSEALPQLARIDEIQGYLGMHPKTIERQLRSGELPGLKIGGRWYVHVAKLAELLERRTSVPAVLRSGTTS